MVPAACRPRVDAVSSATLLDDFTVTLEKFKGLGDDCFLRVSGQEPQSLERFPLQKCSSNYNHKEEWQADQDCVSLSVCLFSRQGTSFVKSGLPGLLAGFLF